MLPSLAWLSVDAIWGPKLMYEKVSPMNGIPLPLGGKGNELHTTTANGIE